MTDLAPKLRQHAGELAAILGDAVPPWTDDVAHTAQQAVEGKIVFTANGAVWTTVGRRDIDWSGPQHAHQEWRAQLNRFYWLKCLASGFRQNGEAIYAQAARDYIEQWLNAHPAADDWRTARYDSSLNLSIRLGNTYFCGWWGAVAALCDSPVFDEKLLQSMLESTQAQMRWLLANLSLGSNWRIANADCLLITGLRLGFLPEAGQWVQAGVRLLNDAFFRQVLPDGAHCERNPSYHSWMTLVMHSCWKLGHARPDLGLAMDAANVQKMYDYWASNLRPNGQFNALHDCQGLRFTAANAPADLLGSPAFVGGRNLQQQAALPEHLPATSAYFPDAGQGFFRDHWGTNATYVCFDATKWGGGHCHLSRNSVQIHALGKSLLVDPGWLNYETSDPFMAVGKSTRAHNTVNLNGWNQATADPTGTYHCHAPGYDLAVSQYTGGYWDSQYHWYFVGGISRGISAGHHRVMLFVHDLGVLVLDTVTRVAASAPEKPEDVPFLESNWQLCEGSACVDNAARQAWTAHDQGNLLLLFPIAPPGSVLELYEGTIEPARRGWLPGGNGLIPAPQVCLRTTNLIDHHATLVTLLIPFAQQQPPRLTVESRPAQGPQAGAVVLRHEDGRCDEFYWMDRLTHMLGKQTSLAGSVEFETDAGLVHLRRSPQGKIIQAAALGGSFLCPWQPHASPRPESFVVKPE